MATTYVGNDGNIAGLLGVKFNSWQATVESVVHDTTGFVNAGRERKLGLIDIRGSASGFAQSEAGASATGAPWALTTNLTGQTVTLYTLYHTTASSASSIQFNAVIEAVPIGVVKTGDNTAGVSFSLSSTATARTSCYTPFWQTS